MSSICNYSPKGSLSVVDLQKIWTGAKIVLTGSLGAIALDYMTKTVADLQLTSYGAIAVSGGLMIAINMLRKYRADNT